MHQPVEVLGAMITPAVLISAAALILLSTVNRLGRVNDRLQKLKSSAEQFAPSFDLDSDYERKQDVCLTQLMNLQRRLVLLRSAVTALYLTIALLVMSSILVGLSVQFLQVPSLLPIGLGMFGAIALLYSISILFLEALIATRVSLAEVGYVRELLERNRDRSKGHPQAAL